MISIGRTVTEKWNIADAKRHFSELIRSAASEPQLIYNRDRLVAAVVNPTTLEEFQRWQAAHRLSVAERFAEYRALAAEEGYELEIPERRDRANPFADRDENSA